MGAVLGIAPGAGATLAAFFAYIAERGGQRSASAYPDQVRGVVAPEAANNAAAVSSFIPTLALGVPGDAAMTLVLSALAIHGVAPGPSWLASSADLFHIIVLSMLLGNVLIFALNIPLIRVWGYLLRVPMLYWRPALALLMVTGVYWSQQSTVDVVVTLVFGLMGAAIKSLRWESVPLFLGFMLSAPLEENARRAWLIADGDWSYFLALPTYVALLVLALVLVMRRWVAR